MLRKCNTDSCYQACGDDLREVSNKNLHLDDIESLPEKLIPNEEDVLVINDADDDYRPKKLTLRALTATPQEILNIFKDTEICEIGPQPRPLISGFTIVVENVFKSRTETTWAVTKISEQYQGSEVTKIANLDDYTYDWQIFRNGEYVHYDGGESPQNTYLELGDGRIIVTYAGSEATIDDLQPVIYDFKIQ